MTHSEESTKLDLILYSNWIHWTIWNFWTSRCRAASSKKLNQHKQRWKGRAAWKMERKKDCVISFRWRIFSFFPNWVVCIQHLALNCMHIQFQCVATHFGLIFKSKLKWKIKKRRWKSGSYSLINYIRNRVCWMAWAMGYGRFGMRFIWNIQIDLCFECKWNGLTVTEQFISLNVWMWIVVSPTIKHLRRLLLAACQMPTHHVRVRWFRTIRVKMANTVFE